METLISLQESAGAPIKVGKRWLVTVARPGQGATGTYPETVLKETGPEAFPPGTKAFFNHDPKRDVRDMVGTYPEGAFWNDEAGELQAYLEPFARYQDVLDQAGANIEASIHAKAYRDPKGTVVRLVKDRANTVDLVAFAGLEGSGLKYQVESLFAAASADGDEGKGNKEMEIEKEIAELKTTVTDLASGFRSFVEAQGAEVQGKADAEAVAAAAQGLVAEALATYIEKEAAIKAAGLFSKQEESLLAMALNGEEITEALEAAKVLAAEARETVLKESADAKPSVRGNVVVVNESKDSAPKSFTVNGWTK